MPGLRADATDEADRGASGADVPCGRLDIPSFVVNERADVHGRRVELLNHSIASRSLGSTIRRSAGFLPALAAAALVIAATARALGAIDMTWDTVAYHLPFIALRMGFMARGEFALMDHLWWFYDGFSPLLDYARGVLWLATGRIEAINTLNILGFFLFVLYVGRCWKLPLGWTALALLAIPILQASLPTGYTDVVSNLALAAVVLCVAESWIDRARLGSPLFWLRLGAAAFVAGNAKLQIGAICLVALAFLLFPLIGYARGLAERRRALVPFALFALVGALASATLIRNAILFGNPVFPVGLTLGPIALAGPYDGADGHYPAYLQGTPQALRWLLSVLEYRALELRGPSYTADMGVAPGDGPSARMGGFLGVFVLLNIFLFVRALLRTPDRRARVLAGMLILSTAVAASMPSSHEARYYLFWMVLLVVSTLVVTFSGRSRDDAAFCKATVCASLAFTIAVTGAFHLRPVPNVGAAYAFHFGRFIEDRGTAGAVYCASAMPNLAFLASPALHRDLANRLPYSVAMANCPEGSVALPPL